MKEVSFRVYGIFVTDFIREAYWHRHKTLKETLEIGKNFIVSPQVEEKEIERMIKAIVFYKGKMVGLSGDESYQYVEEDDEIPSYMKRTVVYYFFHQDELPKYLPSTSFNPKLWEQFLKEKIL